MLEVKLGSTVEKCIEKWKTCKHECFSSYFHQPEQIHTPVLLICHLPIIILTASSKTLFYSRTD